MSRGSSWSNTTELIAHGAVVLSLIYVGVQIKQNTAAIRTDTSQSVYMMHQERVLATLENPEVAELLIRGSLTPESLSAADSLRYRRHLNLTVNLQESVYSNYLLGTLEPGMAAGWLDGMPDAVCEAEAFANYWSESRSAYQAEFVTAMDSAMVVGGCGE